MKICGIICEFNPFHNGHRYLLQKAKELSGCDYLLCIMSGNFTQRGEICVMDKFTRAKHAIEGGADCVIELPAPFAVSPAEIFARGAIKILTAIPSVDFISFGCESGTEKDFLCAADILNNESTKFKKLLNAKLEAGESYKKSYTEAFGAVGGNIEFLSRPNNLLGIEYTKAILKSKSNIKIIPLKRIGSGHGDTEIESEFSSSTAIRNNLNAQEIKNNVPDFVYNDMYDFTQIIHAFKYAVKLVLSRTDSDALKKIYGCGEGLDNKLKNLQKFSYDEIIRQTTSKRYQSSRISRILCSAFLKIYHEDCEAYLQNNLYISPLAVKESKADKILSLLSESPYSIITKGKDIEKLDKIAKKCKRSDEFAFSQWQQITGAVINEKIRIVN